MTFIKRFWFLLVTALALILGLSLHRFSIASSLVLISGALVGLALAIQWTWATMRKGEFGSDSLAIIAIVASLAIGEHLASAIVSLMLATGRALEDWAKSKSQRELKSLLERAPRFAHIVDNLQVTRDVELSLVKIGNRMRVLSGEVVPIDGVLQTDGEFDESALTGEPMPVFRQRGEIVSSGVVNCSGSVELVANCSAEQSTYANLIRLVATATASSSQTVRLANRWALWFVPMTLVLAAFTLLISKDLHIAVAVLIAATPCPLILAIPAAIISGMSRSATQGAVIKGGQTLELLAKTKTVMLDKTGTLTKGGPSISQLVVAESISADRALQLAASLEQHSPHVVAKAVLEAAAQRSLKLLEASDVIEMHGHSISGLIEGQRVTLGQPTENLPEWADLDAELLVAISIDGDLVAMLGLDDPIREESLETISNLRKLGIDRIVLVSGDRAKSANSIGALISADEVFAECTPQQKLDLVVTEMRSAYSGVVLVGDGINDAPALATASVGVAMGARGSTAASEAADVVIVEDSLRHLALAIDVSQGAFRKARQAGAVGMSLAIVSMFAAAFGVLSPTQAAVVQELIDAAAILWALTPLRSRLK